MARPTRVRFSLPDGGPSDPSMDSTLSIHQYNRSILQPNSSFPLYSSHRERQDWSPKQGQQIIGGKHNNHQYNQRSGEKVMKGHFHQGEQKGYISEMYNSAIKVKKAQILTTFRAASLLAVPPSHEEKTDEDGRDLREHHTDTFSVNTSSNVGMHNWDLSTNPNTFKSFHSEIRQYEDKDSKNESGSTLLIKTNSPHPSSSSSIGARRYLVDTFVKKRTLHISGCPVKYHETLVDHMRSKFCGQIANYRTLSPSSPTTVESIPASIHTAPLRITFIDEQYADRALKWINCREAGISSCLPHEHRISAVCMAEMPSERDNSGHMLPQKHQQRLGQSSSSYPNYYGSFSRSRREMSGMDNTSSLSVQSSCSQPKNSHVSSWGLIQDEASQYYGSTASDQKVKTESDSFQVINSNNNNNNNINNILRYFRFLSPGVSHNGSHIAKRSENPKLWGKRHHAHLSGERRLGVRARSRCTNITRVKYPRLMALPLSEYWLLPFIREDDDYEDDLGIFDSDE
eukprot:Tbor_TRINITY_DN3042_c0_g1::TRINITY_DN3042_c0_g1_i1::g.17346::m.17346